MLILLLISDLLFQRIVLDEHDRFVKCDNYRRQERDTEKVQFYSNSARVMSGESEIM
jgi:hypothetical protein